MKVEFSFDDGFKLDMKVADILEEYGVRGIFYVVIDWIGEPGFLTWDQIKELEARGHKIGSHTMSHPPDLKMLFEEELFYEISNSKDVLEAVLNHPISSFCYPRGRGDARVRATVAQAGYAEARATGAPGVSKYTDPLWKPGTLHISTNRKEYTNGFRAFARDTLSNPDAEYINIWGHSAEIERMNCWDDFEYALDLAVGRVAL